MPVNRRGLYSILRINPDATMEEVRLAYLNICNIYQSDSPEDLKIREEAEQAYYILGNYHSRREYDNELERRKSKPQTQFQNTRSLEINPYHSPLPRRLKEFNDLFEDHIFNPMIPQIIMEDHEIENHSNPNKTQNQTHHYNYQSQTKTHYDPATHQYKTVKTTTLDNNGEHQDSVENYIHDEMGNLVSQGSQNPNRLLSRPNRRSKFQSSNTRRINRNRMIKD